MGLLALHHHPHSKEPGWGFPGSQEMPSQQQPLLPASSITSQTDPGWALSLPAPAWGSTGSWCHQQWAMSLMEPLHCVSAWPCPDTRGPRTRPAMFSPSRPASS